MLSRTLRRSRLAPSPGAPSLHQRQIRHFHLTPSVSTAKGVGETPAGNLLAKGWREKTVVELKVELKRRGLPTTGKKEELVRRLTNANVNFGATEAFGATSRVSLTKTIKSKKSMASMTTLTAIPFTTPVKEPPVPNIPDLYAAPIVAPTLKVSAQSLMSNLRIGTMPSSPMSPTLLNKSAFVNLRTTSTLTPSKSSAPSKIPQSPPKQRHLHTSKPVNTMLSDNVRLPTFTAEIPIEIPRVPILPTTQRAPPPIEMEPLPTVHPIVTAAGAYTHPAPPGGGSDHTKEHLQSDLSKRRTIEKESEKQDGRFEGDWHGESQSSGDTFKFIPETDEIPASDKRILWGFLGAATLWGVFGPGEKKDGKK